MGPRLRALFGAAVATARACPPRNGSRHTRPVRRAHRSGHRLGGAQGRPTQVAVIGTGRMARVVVERLAELDIVPDVYGRSVERAERLSQRTAPCVAIHKIPRHWVWPTSCLRDVGVESSGDGYRGAACNANRAGRRLTWSTVGAEPTSSRARGRSPECASSTSMTFESAPATPDRVELDAALDEAQAIVAEALRRFDAARHGRVVGPVIVQLQQTAEEAYRRSLRQHRPELVVDGTLDQVARALARRHVHHCIIDVREAAQRDDVEAIERIIRSFTDNESPDLVRHG